MEVFYDSVVHVKAKLSRATLHLTRVDQLRNYYYSSILFYQGIERAHVEGQERNNMAVLQAVRCGMDAMIEHYPWAAGRINVAKHSRISPANGDEEEEELLEVYINEDGGPGIQLVEARVNLPLQDLGDLSDPNPAFEPLFATIDEKGPFQSRPVVALQVSRFLCGGFSVAMTSNHVLFDGIGASIFLQNLGSCARGEGMCVPFDLTPRNHRISPRNPPAPKFPCAHNLVPKADFKHLTPKQAAFLASLPAKKYVFTDHDLAELRLNALTKQDDCKKGFQKCSRFQVMTAHIWRAKARCMMALYGDPLEEFSLHIVVNLRERIMEGIPKGYVGNALGVSRPYATIGELTEKSLAFAVEAIQEAIKRVTAEAFQSDVDHLEILGSSVRMLLPSMAVPYLSNLGFYDVDFGWGKPTNFGRHYMQTRNKIIVMDGNAQGTLLIAYASFISEDESRIFQEGLQEGLKCKFGES